MLRYVLSDIPALTLDLSIENPEFSSNTTGLYSGCAQYLINEEKTARMSVLLVLTTVFSQRP
jgi:hypothetical protein